MLSIELGLSRVTSDTQPNTTSTTTTNFIILNTNSNDSHTRRSGGGSVNQSQPTGTTTDHILSSIGDELASFAKHPDLNLKGRDLEGGGPGGNVSSSQPAGFTDVPRRDDSRAETVIIGGGGGVPFSEEAISNKKEGGGALFGNGVAGAGSSNGQNGDASGSGKQAQQGRETTWQKLSNRIKALERNVSLSTGFLEELSLKYIKQIDELNSQLKVTGESIAVVQRREEACRMKGQLLERRLDELAGELGRVVERLAGLQEEVMARHGLLLLLEVLLLGLVLFWCSPARQPALTKQHVMEGGIRYHNLFRLTVHCCIPYIINHRRTVPTGTI